MNAGALGAGVVVAHPGRQWSYEVAVAAQQRHSLRAFATGFYVRRARVAKALAAAGSRSNVLGSVGDRFHPALDPSLVKTFRKGQLRAWALRSSPYGASARLWAERRCDDAIARWLRSLDPRPGVVHVWEGGGLATLRAARAIGAATVLDVGSAHERFWEVVEAEGVSLENVVTAAVVAERELADVLVVPSEYVAECLVEHDVPRERIVRIPFGVDAERFAPLARREDDLFRVLFVGSSGIRKGLPYLLEAWAELDLPGSELVVAGATDLGERRASNGRCRFLGQVPRAGMADWFARSDVFVLPSLAEGSALVIYEAMASGLPVVTTPNAGAVLEDGVHGFLVPPRDVAALSERIRELYDDPGRRRELGRAGRALVLSRYTWKHYRARIAAVHRALLRGEDVARAVAEIDDDRLLELVP
jgi:glycosyltransferase involved in cell wall biosynthesis